MDIPTGVPDLPSGVDSRGTVQCSIRSSFAPSAMSDPSPNSFATFGELLKYLRRRAGLKQRELGLAVGYSAAQITRLEGGQRPPDVLAVKTQFVMALGLAHEPELAARLIKLA